MKRILTLTLVGILLLPSLFACGQTPQATTTAPTTATATEPAPTPAIEIGESGSTHEEYKIEIVEHAWSKEEAWLILQYTSACAKNLRNWDLFVQKKNGDAWENLAEYKGEELGKIGFLSSEYLYKFNSKLQGNPITLLGLNPLFDSLSNGDYRVFVTFRSEEEAASAPSSVEVWANFSITGMTPIRSTDVAFSQQILDIDVYDIYEEPVQVFRSAEEWNAFREACCEAIPFVPSKDVFLESTSRYDEAYFKEHILILAKISRRSGTYEHEIKQLKKKEDGMLSLCVETTRLGFTCDLGRWFLLIEPEAGITVESAEDVAFYLDGHEVGKEYPLLTEYLGI